MPTHTNADASTANDVPKITPPITPAITPAVLTDIRIEYLRERLLEHAVPRDPLELFAVWLTEAIAAGLHEPNAMTLATADDQGRPSARMMLLKDFDALGFCFCTHYDSRKGRELAANPWASLVFWWGPLERQVRIEGHVGKVAAAESDAYYQSRPLGSRLGAWISPQSRLIPDRAHLEARLAAVEAEFADQTPARPPFWGGYRLAPTSIEFWQGGPHRLHDRLRYTRPAHEKPRQKGPTYEELKHEESAHEELKHKELKHEEPVQSEPWIVERLSP